MQLLRYSPSFNKVTGGVTSTLVMLQLEYLFGKTSGKMFFKYLEPCGEDSYVPGESWTEEVGFSKAEFRHAFSKIGVAYKSKKLYKEAADKFQGKMYASYFDRIQRKTYYIRNEALVEQVLFKIAHQETISFKKS